LEKIPTESPSPLQLDHIGVIVRDLDAGQRCWERMGFTLSQRSPQMGLDATKQHFEPWATANHCAVFQRGYMELIGIHRHGLFNPWEAHLARFEGPHIVALRCDSADNVYPSIAQACDDFEPPVQRRRDAPYGNATREMRFRNIFSKDSQVPECRYIVIEHQTPDVLWQHEFPNSMVHANGALALESITLCAPPSSSLDRRLSALAAPEKVDAHGVTFDNGYRLEVSDAKGLVERFPGTTVRPDAALAACCVGVANLADTTRWLNRHDIAHVEAPGRTWVRPEFANGCIVEFVSQSRLEKPS
jgi:catechol 2,3-dioxygenase-like lactoylglutathione lyase family enzyme